MRKLSTALLTAALLSFPAFATIIHIPGDYPTIQAGIDAAQNSDTVLVADGYYNESIDYIGKAISVISENGPQSTIIDPYANLPTVTIYDIADSGAVIEGFTITNSFTNNPSFVHGIYCSHSSPIIRNNIIHNIGGVWSHIGGGICADQAQPVIEYNQIHGNQCAYYGGGIYITNCDTAIVRHNKICENYVYSGYGYAYGGGICIQQSNVLVERNLINNNWAHPSYCMGGAISIADSSTVHIYNNTFSGNQGDGICISGYFAPGQLRFVNNILVDTYGYGLISSWGFNDMFIDYNDIYNNSAGGYFNCQPGEHDISADPLFVNAGAGDYHLTANSPCIDAGDPASPLDPDSTRADMGAFYFHQGGISPITITLTPYNPPIQIPAGGGTFDFNIAVENSSNEPQTFDLWTVIHLPEVGEIEILNIPNLTIPSNTTIDRDRSQAVPAFAPAGTYTYYAYLGDYPWVVNHYDSFTFEKLGSDGGGYLGMPSDWLCTGEPFSNEGLTSIHPSEFILHPCNPNPFNPTTVLSFELPDASFVELIIYDIRGREVARLVDDWYPEGFHEATFDASGLSSGVYFARLTAGEFIAVGKMVMMK